VGLVVALAATVLGAVAGAAAGYFAGSWLDEVLLWAMGVLDAIPFYLFVAAVAFALQDSPYAMQVGMIATFWIGTAGSSVARS
jgi:ABC-type dipeptide/oligopeptide/nickel transport system permease subunit